ncbi:restriction endonuclease subunit S [Endozoicomonas sp. SCSIO W0465]|uniref:restriction endonuclease subunit S n=1 Tax=Endozoicomonas sp. SCSIO W0465 TaxID=2918516 RepID=UPI0020758578|nr:restriction endonuclease subunit S [Endozoicomonas sp. SCSIO W0465]USE38703.1 restriction endonuclease subunit S [Endozoicomonas sp. SCSIO W0465]
MELKPGYKQTEVGVIPEDWSAISLGNLAQIQRGASPRPIDSPVWFDENSKTGWLRISDVSKSNKYLKNTLQSLSDKGIANSRFVPSKSLVMSICATVGRPIITLKDVCIHDGFVVFGNLKTNMDFLYYVLTDLEKDWSKHGQTGSQMNLNTGLINSTKIPLPPTKAEQQAIANALSDMDTLIQSLEQQIIKKQQIKQGAMQSLLNPYDENGNLKNGWLTKPLSELAEILKVDIKLHPLHRSLILYALNNHPVQGVLVSHYFPRSPVAF